ncbi:MAG: LON peptidase substrate-binding domain-containing protein [Alphaproteobacteria bacterium]
MKNYILPLRDIVVHPGLTMPIYLDIPTSVDCLKTASNFGNQIILVPQRSWGYPTNVDDLYDIGTIGNIVQILNLPDGSVHSIVRTTDAVKLSDIQMVDGLFVGNAEKIEIADDMESEQTLALRDKIIENLRNITAPKKIKMEKLYNVVRNYPLPAFIDSIIQTLNIDTDTALKILSALSWQQKLIILLEQVNLSAETAKIEENINTRVRQQMENGRRDAILQEKLRAIQREMGEDDETADTNNMRKKIENAHLPADVLDKAKSEWKRMRTMSPMSQEGGLIKNYLDELLSMPWENSPQQPIDLKRARETLDAEHSGMQPVKERILEHIAVMKKTGTPRGSILCFVGAPGVGKTSLCKSIATALGRKYQRISLGGISDESHFRGHRKTYIGAQTGRIMDALKRCKTNNPVIVLDEIDKMGRDWRGDPESALLEILDPEQNKSFRDHYLEVDFDLSNVLFIATANSLNMSSALKDRMEIINVPGYTEDDKVQITREHLLKRVADENGWDVNNIVISDDAIRHIVRNYTSEQGVRSLQRELATLLRRQLLANDGADIKTEFTIPMIDDLLSIRNYGDVTHKIGFGMRAQ